MYESPIEVIMQDMEMKFEGEVVRAVQKVGINVSREELIKALEYDRGQYSKGYADGVKELAERLKEHMCNYDLDNYHSFRAIKEEVLDDVVRDTMYWRAK